MPAANLQELFHETLKDIYFAEKAILKALPKMAKKATSESLSQAFITHQEQTDNQVLRLEEVFKILGKKPQGKRCPAIEGILEEGEELMKDLSDPTTRDAAMVGAAQAVEHYEIARYGTLISWANKLGYFDATELLQETLAEEQSTDKSLSKLAETEINLEADHIDLPTTNAWNQA